MYRSRRQRLIAFALVLAHLVLGTLMPLSGAHAAAHPTPAHTMMMDGQPCTGMTDDGQPAALQHDGDCCKSSQCPCLHAPALTRMLPLAEPVRSGYTEVVPTEIHRLTAPPAVFFRPPIQRA